MRADLEVRVMVTPGELSELYPFRYVTWCRWLREGRVKGAVKVNSRWLIPWKVAQQMMAGAGVQPVLVTQIARLKQQEEARHGVSA